MYDSLVRWLDGKKTYLVAVAAVATATAAVVSGEITGAQYVTSVFVSIGSITMRAGIKKSGA